MNLSNDGYFGKSAAREQHLELVRMRAAENRRWILRATNDGITAMIDPRGRVTDVLQPYHELAAAMQYGYVSQVTPYTQYGDWFAWGCLIIGLGAVAGARFRKRMVPLAVKTAPSRSRLGNPLNLQSRARE